MVKGFYISDDLEDMDIEVIFRFISESYWGKGIPLEALQKSLQHSLCFGIFSDTGQQVGFARMITDRATFAYLSDVYIDEAFRGRGLSKYLMDTLLAHPDLQGLRRILLATADAHKLYEKSGFVPLAKPEYFMEIWKPDIYQEQ